MIRHYKDLEAFQYSYELALEIFGLKRKFPKEELFSLTSQINRSARSISANIVEGWAKRKYEKVFKQHLISALGSWAETENWLAFARDFHYIDLQTFSEINAKTKSTGGLIIKLHKNRRTFKGD